jgi:hypothetical protein
LRNFCFAVDAQSVNSSTGTDGTWEDNWLFKKRKLKTENQSIAMLVPSPTEEIKALIGDKNADETSDLSENEDDDDKEPFTVIKAKDVDSLKSMQSLTSMDTSDPTVITEAKNNLLLVDDAVFMKPEPIQKINFVLSGPVTTVGEKPLGELSVKVDKPTTEEEQFDSMVSPTQVREHKKSIDEDFERLLMDDNNNNNNSQLNLTGSELFMSPESKAPAK